MTRTIEGYDVQEKNLIRTELFEMLKRNNGKKPFKKVMLLPAATMLCVKEGLRVGVFDHNTIIYAIDKDYQTCKQIEAGLQSLGFKNFVVIYRELKNTNPTNWVNPTEDFLTNVNPYTRVYINNIPFDMIYLDVCGLLTRDIQNWINDDLLPALSYDCEVCFTFQNTDRTKSYDRWIPGTQQKTSYICSTIAKTQKNSCSLLETLRDCLGSPENYVAYARAYMNSNLTGKRSKGSPMLTCYFRPKKNGSQAKRFSGRSDTLDLGYRPKIRYKRRIWQGDCDIQAPPLEMPENMEVSW